ncbi:MAG: alkaline phosphatase [Deltaproteobacteria bacterium]|nr:alkaline phosphatase [Deltaproteobacteria bacterium]
MRVLFKKSKKLVIGILCVFALSFAGCSEDNSADEDVTGDTEVGTDSLDCPECGTCTDEECETCTDEECATCDTCETCDMCSDCTVDTGEEVKKAKYVFYLIGDGMSLTQVGAAEQYNASLADSLGWINFQDSSNQARDDDGNPFAVHDAVYLNMSTLNVTGLATTYAYNSYITDSAAAATALASGMKTDCGVLGRSPDLMTDYPTIAEEAKEAGMKVGIISSVSIDHATPAGFYAHNDSRNNYADISMAAVGSNIDYFAGNGPRFDKHADGGAALISALTTDGYTITTNRSELDSATSSTGKVYAYNYSNGVNIKKDSLPYVMDQTADDISLKEFTEKGIELLDGDKGFFMMVEAGKIDWAGHANDAAANIKNTLHFDEIVGVALEFYKKHPHETLIVVTGDHETGGMSLGFASTGYGSWYELIDKQTVSYEVYTSELMAMMSSDTPPESLSDLNDSIEETFGLDMDDNGTGVALTDLERSRLEAAFADTVSSGSGLSADEQYLAYGGYYPLVIALTHILNNKAGIGWTSYSHTGVNVPVYVTGPGEEKFIGNYDNTDIQKFTKEAMGL